MWPSSDGGTRGGGGSVGFFKPKTIRNRTGATSAEATAEMAEEGARSGTQHSPAEQPDLPPAPTPRGAAPRGYSSPTVGNSELFVSTRAVQLHTPQQNAPQLPTSSRGTKPLAGLYTAPKNTQHPQRELSSRAHHYHPTHPSAGNTPRRCPPRLGQLHPALTSTALARTSHL